MEYGTQTLHATMPINVGNIRRATALQRAIDPDRSLPEIWFECSPTQLVEAADYRRERYFFGHDASFLGEVVIGTNEAQNTRWIDYLHIGADTRDLFVLALFTAVARRALGDDYQFRSSPNAESITIAPIWEALAANGIARVIKPFSPLDARSLSGHYQINDLSPAAPSVTPVPMPDPEAAIAARHSGQP